ncbi:MAG: glucose-1-phosphate thymidylyltransferase RfbA [Flavobacteriaceae bacterium]|nr:glucose-1-phosphate thymidylyltransferase RfbA [Flavobacteriaceae bacterium]
MKGIILAGGSGTRLYPLTKVVSKQLLPVYDKPMIYYPLSVLMLAGIKEVLIISTPLDLPNFKKLFNDGSQLGLKLSYKEQPNPDGLAQAFIIGKDFIANDDVCLILGDNIFYGAGFQNTLKKAVNVVKDERKSIIFGYEVKDPNRYGVAVINKNGNVKSIEEKPDFPKSNYAVVGLYFYTNDVVQIAKNVRVSKRGELEITSVNQEFLAKNKLKMQLLGRGFAWLDSGTHESMNDASEFIKTIEKRTGLKVACIEEIAWRMNYINKSQLLKLADELGKSSYANYLRAL